MIIHIFTIFTLFLVLQPCGAQEEFSGFNYPIGSRNPGFITGASDTDGWYYFDYQTYDNDPRTDGFHSGEDWNDDCGGSTDIGADVYAVADGEVIGVRDYIGASGTSLGDVLTIKHPLDSEESVYSLSLHINSIVNVGDSVKRDQRIGTIANISLAGLSPHFHFELRTKPISINNLWPNDDDGRPNNAYYNDSKNTAGEVIETYEQKMDADGLIDPSDFIDAHRPFPTSSLQRGKIPHDFYFNHDLASGMCKYEIRYLQNLLNSNPDTRVSTEDKGSIGNEISNFGALTRSAVIKFQEKYVEGESSGEVNSATRDEMNRVLSAARANPNVDVVLIIDSSGSMIWTDPDDARLDAARAYLTGSFAGDFIGVVDLDNTARQASVLQRIPDNKDNLIEAIDTIDSSGGTNIGLALKEGCQVLKESLSDYNFTKGAILLTDGEGSYNNEDVCLQKAVWPVYTFGLGENADHELLKNIASNTGGEYTDLPTSSLICEFQRIRGKIAGATPPTCKSFTILQLETTTFYVEVDSGQLQITFSTDWLGSDILTTLVTPSGRIIDRNKLSEDVNHDKGESFEIFTIINPEAGKWEVKLFGLDVPSEGEDATFGFTSIPKSINPANIDVKPGSNRNSVNPKSHGVTPVAILTTDSVENTPFLDASTIDVTKIRFGLNGTETVPVHDALEDVDGDGDLDLILHFNIQKTGINCGDSSVVLTGETFDGQAIKGSDSIVTVGCKIMQY